MEVLKKSARKIQILALPITNILLLLACAQLGKSSLAIFIFSGFAMIMYFLSLFSKPGNVQKEVGIDIDRLLSKSQPIVPHLRIDFDQITKALEDNVQEQNLGIESIMKEQRPEKLTNICEEEKIKQRNINQILQIPNKVSDSLIEKKINSVQLQQPSKIANQQLYEKNPALISIQQSSNFTIVPAELQKIKRFCSHCKIIQPLRVRHCVQCHSCILNFDHHCPWINNCVGQKNKLILTLLTVSQVIYLSHIFYTIWPQDKQMINYYSFALWVLVGFCTLIAYGMLCMQCFFIGRNITTWEYMRWNRIEYTSIFDQAKLKSLFNQGVLRNWAIFLKSNWIKKPTVWKKYLSREAHLYVITQESQTDRKIVQ